MSSVLLALLSAYNDHDAAAAAALYCSGGEHVEIAQDTIRCGPEALRDSLENFLRAFPDAHWEVGDAALDRPLSAAPYRLTGTLSGRLGPFDPAGQQLDLRGVMVAQIGADDGLIVRSSDYWDSATFARQMRGR